MDYGEHEEVQQVHAAIQREKREPRVGLEPLSMWLIVVYGVAIFWGGAYLGRFSGSFSGDGLDPGIQPQARKVGPGQDQGAAQELTQAERGKKVYSSVCATCHQMNGMGVAGQYPPLAGSEYVIAGSKRPAMIVLKGAQGPMKVKGVQYGSAVMQPWDKTLNDQKVADVLTFIRQEWGNTAPPVAPEGIAALRKELAGHPNSWTEAELLAVPPDANVAGGETAAPAGEPPKPAAEPKP
jgi:mono/diheme cytochrome c family protein